VLLLGTIGKDGKVRDLQVILSPSPLLSESAVEAVSHWEYKPYLQNGEPVEGIHSANAMVDDTGGRRIGYFASLAA
jgi:outer membrane biosynthesis protein TonB